MWDRRLVQQQLPGCRCSLFWSHVHTVLNLVALFHSPCEQSGVLNMDSGVKNMCRDLPTIKTTHDSSFTFSSSTTNRSERPHPSGDGPELCQIFLLTFVQKQQLQLCNSESSPEAEQKSSCTNSSMMSSCRLTRVCSAGLKVVGFAMYYFTYDPWVGKQLYLEDFYVMEAYRGMNICSSPHWIDVIFVFLKKFLTCCVCTHFPSSPQPHIHWLIIPFCVTE